MAFYNYSFPAVNATTIANAQAILLNQAMTLNGTSTGTSTGGTRFVTITIANAANSTAFQISGNQNGVNVQTTLTFAGGATTASTTMSFDNVTSVVPTNIVDNPGNVSVGIGITGYFPMVLVNTLGATLEYAVSLAMSGGGNSSCTIYEGLPMLTLTSYGVSTYDQLVATNQVIATSSINPNPVVVTKLLQMTDVCQALLVGVTLGDPAYNVGMQFLQQ